MSGLDPTRKRLDFDSRLAGGLFGLAGGGCSGACASRALVRLAPGTLMQIDVLEEQSAASERELRKPMPRCRALLRAAADRGSLGSSPSRSPPRSARSPASRRRPSPPVTAPDPESVIPNSAPLTDCPSSQRGRLQARPLLPDGNWASRSAGRLRLALEPAVSPSVRYLDHTRRMASLDPCGGRSPSHGWVYCRSHSWWAFVRSATRATPIVGDTRLDPRVKIKRG
jgi:hypothetical protein